MSSHVKSYLQLYTWKEQLKEKDNYSCMSSLSLSGSLFVSLSFLFIQMIWEPIFQIFIYLLIHEFFKIIHQILSDIVCHTISTKMFFFKKFHIFYCVLHNFLCWCHKQGRHTLWKNLCITNILGTKTIFSQKRCAFSWNLYFLKWIIL